MPKSNHPNVPSFKIISIWYQELFVIWFADADTWVNQTLSFLYSLTISLTHIVFCCDLITISCPDVWASFQILSLNIWTCGNTCNGDCPALKLNFYNPWYHLKWFISPAFAYPWLWSRSYRPPSLCLFWLRKISRQKNWFTAAVRLPPKVAPWVTRVMFWLPRLRCYDSEL